MRGGSGAFSAPGASGGAVFVISVSEDFGVELDDEAVISRGASPQAVDSRIGSERTAMRRLFMRAL
jgi:hypothetical protein